LTSALGLLVSVAYAGDKIPIDIVELNPKPNYSLTTDAQDFNQLTDTSIARYPIWVHKESVGWSAKTPVLIKVKLKINEQKGLFVARFHTSKRWAAGVDIPRLIDVYEEVSSNSYRHVSSVTFDSRKYADTKNHWLDVEFNRQYEILVFVVHANRNFIMLDEIELQYTGDAIKNKENQKVELNEKNLVRDSRDRLKKMLHNPVANIRSGLASYASGLSYQVVNPWLRIDNKSIVHKTSVQIQGYQGEKESALIRIINKTRKSIRLKPVASDMADVALSYRVLDKVLVSDGSVVYDPLTEVPSVGIEVKANSMSYLWVTADLSNIPLGKSKNSLVLRAEDRVSALTVPFDFDVVRQLDARGKGLNAVVWGYVSDKPVWSNPKLNIEDLEDHGVNVHVLPPADLPQFSSGSRKYKNQRFIDRLDLYRGKGKLLLYMAWDRKVGENQKQEHLKSDLLNWLKIVVKLLDENGFDRDDWALYPIDEPIGEKIEQLIQVASWIKAVDKNINVYANPIKTQSKRITISDIDRLIQVVDIMQPDYAFANSMLADYISQKKQVEWWIYENPTPPSKAASPLHYMGLSWKALSLGANGVGVWSYSDTAGSSAWDDFDGVRPDWSMVYEGENGPHSSRRWEAFREGIEDFLLINSVKSERKNAKSECSSKSSDIGSLKKINNKREFVLHRSYFRFACISLLKGGLK
jgi:hypothetical protein